MNRLTRVAVLATAAALSTAAVTATASSATAAGPTVHGCPSGAVCIYPENRGWNSNHPSLEFWSYGAHNLSGQYGRHYVLNNQYVDDNSGWPEAILCKGYNGTSCVGSSELSPYQKLPSDASANADLGPINSVFLYHR